MPREGEEQAPAKKLLEVADACQVDSPGKRISLEDAAKGVLRAVRDAGHDVHYRPGNGTDGALEGAVEALVTANGSDAGTIPTGGDGAAAAERLGGDEAVSVPPQRPSQGHVGHGARQGVGKHPGKGGKQNKQGGKPKHQHQQHRGKPNQQDKANAMNGDRGHKEANQQPKRKEAGAQQQGEKQRQGDGARGPPLPIQSHFSDGWAISLDTNGRELRFTNWVGTDVECKGIYLWEGAPSTPRCLSRCQAVLKRVHGRREARVE